MLEGEHNGWVRLSADGTSWSDRIDAGRPVAWIATIAPYGDGLIVVGRRDGDLVAWTSRDGEQWRRMDGPPIFDGDEPRNVMAYPQQLVTVGDRTLLQGVVACPEDMCAEAGPRLWGVTRGGHWGQLPVRIDEGRITDVFAGRGRFLATVETGHGVAADLLMASRDGRSWRQVGALAPDAARDHVQLGETDAGMVLLDTDGDPVGPVILTSADGTTWMPAWTPPPLADVEWQSLEVDGAAAMVIGYSSAAGPLAVVSADGGAAWALFAASPETAGACFRGGAVRGATAVTIGECGSDARAWVATIPGVAVASPAISLTGPIDPADVPFVFACSGMQFTASDVAEAPRLGEVDPDGLDIVRGIAARKGWAELDWRRVATKGTRTMAVAADASGALATVVFGEGGVLIGAAIGPFCGRAPGFSAIARVAMDPTKPAPTRNSRVLHLQTIGCSDQTAFPARITMLPRHLLFRVSLTGSASEVGCGDTIRFDVRLPEPLGQRRIWNAARLPLKELVRP